MFPWDLMAKDSNGYLVAPRWLAIAVPLLAVGTSWGATYALLESRVSTLEAGAKRHEAVLERLIRIETILDELKARSR